MAYNEPKQVGEDADAAEELFNTLFSEEADDSEEADTSEEASEEEEVDTSEDEEEEQKEEDTYARRYQSLKGKYDKEVPRLQKEIEELRKQMQPPEKDDQQDLAAKLDEYREAVGDETVDIIQNIVNMKTGEATKPLEEKVNSIEETSLNAKREAFSTQLSEKAKGDWEPLLNGDDDKFLEFLEQSDPNGLYTYGDILEQANKSWNADKMAKVVNLYLDGKEEVSKKQKEVSKSAEDALVAPNRKGHSPAPKGSEPRIWTENQVKQFEADDRNGKYTKEESDALWNDLLMAPSEGRMR